MARVFVLGAGTPTPTPHRFGSAFAVEIGGEYAMFDCGPAAFLDNLVSAVKLAPQGKSKVASRLGKSYNSAGSANSPKRG
jgi:ribonuclease BN (tRNA processing enzyme)